MEYRKRLIFCITTHLGKGINILLSKVKIVDSQYNKIWYYNKNDLENKIISHSKQYFTKACQSKTYNDKICNKLVRDDVRNRIL